MKYSRHHVIPVSRMSGQGKRINRDCFCKTCKNKEVRLPIKFHDAYHKVFGNLTPTEAIEFLIWLNDRMWVSKKITPNQIDEIQNKIKEGR